MNIVLLDPSDPALPELEWNEITVWVSNANDLAPLLQEVDQDTPPGSTINIYAHGDSDGFVKGLEGSWTDFDKIAEQQYDFRNCTFYFYSCNSAEGRSDSQMEDLKSSLGTGNTVYAYKGRSYSVGAIDFGRGRVKY